MRMVIQPLLVPSYIIIVLFSLSLFVFYFKQFLKIFLGSMLPDLPNGAPAYDNHIHFV